MNYIKMSLIRGISLNFSNVLSSLIGVLVGSFISWLSNKWLNNKKLSTEIKIKTIDEISNKILDLCNGIYSIYQLNQMFNSLLSLYLDESQRGKISYEKLDEYFNELEEEISNLEKEYEGFYVFLGIKEIAIKKYSKLIRELNQSFWKYLINLDGLHHLYIRDIYKSEEFSDIIEYLTKRESSEIIKEQHELDNDINNSYKDMLLKMWKLNDELLNEAYGKIFNSKKEKRIYEVDCGKVMAIEDIYTLDKAKQIYKQNKIKREL